MNTFQVAVLSVSLTINFVVILALSFFVSENFDYKFTGLERREASVSKEVVLSRASDDDYLTTILKQQK